MKNYVAATALDSSLIEVRHDRDWSIFLCVLIAFVFCLTVSWLAVIEGFVRLKIPFAFTTGEHNVGEFLRALYTPRAEVAIVGSSLSKRLEPGLFNKTTLVNFSVGGGSVMTGLEVLKSQKYLPKTILVEINVLDRQIDQELADKGKAASKSLVWAVFSGDTKPLRYVLTQPRLSYVPAQVQSAWWNTKRSSSLSQKAAEYDLRATISAGTASWDKRNSWDVASQNFKRIAELILEFESRGTRVYLLYLPYAAGYDEHTYAKRNRKIASGSDTFRCARCIDVRELVDVNDLRWADGAHLDDRSAAIVADALQKRLLAGQL